MEEVGGDTPVPRGAHLDDASEKGGHRLRARDNTGRAIPRNRTVDPTRPSSVLSPRRGGLSESEGLRTVLNIDTTAEDDRQAIPLGTKTYGDYESDEDEDDYDDEPYAAEGAHLGDDAPTAAANAQPTAEGAQLGDDATAAVNNARPTTATPTRTGATPPRPPHATPSALATAAQAQLSRAGTSLEADLAWQSEVAGEAARQKQFREEALRQLDLVVFAYMRPGSATVQLLHSAATFSMRGGDTDLRGKDFAFIGDRTGHRNPAAVLLPPEQPWKWLTKSAVLDVGGMELFYANPANARILWKPDVMAGEQNITVPRMLALPPQVIAFCTEEQRTPFALHQFVAEYALRTGGDDRLHKCKLLLDWCLVASHQDASPTTSVLAMTMQAAPVDDDVLGEWLVRRLEHTLGPVAPPTPPPAPMPPIPPPGTLPNPPQGQPPDVWAQMAAQLTQGIVTAAAALPQHGSGPGHHSDPASAYEEGGKKYDEYQQAILKGFAHTHELKDVPRIWGAFQSTKHMDTHRDNITRAMAVWATSQPQHVTIDRSLYLPVTTLRDILALRFNPGGTMAELDTADCGLSILICRARSSESKSALKRRELAEERTRATRTLAEEERLGKDSSTKLCPEDYNELLRCLGTYCALLHTLFGHRCAFYKQCLQLWETMEPDFVYERRHFFSPLYCRQLVWAIIEEGRAYFSKRLSPDNFVGIDPYDIRYPRSTLSELCGMVRHQTPIIRSSFPDEWAMTTTRTRAATTSSGGTAMAAPVPSITTGTQAPSVVSALSTGTGTRTTNTQGTRTPVTIRATNIHPTIKALMEPHIAKWRGVLLGAMCDHLNISLDDLPKLPGESALCYNFVLGRCVIAGCNHRDGHVNASDITDEFATAITEKLRPAVAHFKANGAPPPRWQNRRRRRE